MTPSLAITVACLVNSHVWMLVSALAIWIGRRGVFPRWLRRLNWTAFVLNAMSIIVNAVILCDRLGWVG